MKQQQYFDNIKKFQLPNRYRELAKSPWTDHVYYFVPIFEHLQVKNLLEFGLGNGSQVFIDYCDHVTSIEMVVDSENNQWFSHCKEKFSSVKNWTPIEYQCNELLLKAHSISWRSHNPTEFLKEYTFYLREVVTSFLRKENYELVFVDSGFAARADIINAVFSEVPIVVTHDTKHDPKMYGWGRIQVPGEYTEIHLDTPQGLTFWVRDSHQEWVETLLAVRKHLPYKNLS